MMRNRRNSEHHDNRRAQSLPNSNAGWRGKGSNYKAGGTVAGEGKCENSNGESGTQRTRALQGELIAVDYIREGVIKGCEDF